MEPKEKDFAAPILEFFKPKKREGIVGIALEGGFARFYTKEDDSCLSDADSGSLLFPGNAVKNAYINDLGGLSVGFSTIVTYDGNALQNVLLKVFPYEKPIGFGYDGVARVRKADEEVVWENAYVPEKKKLLRTR